MKKIFYVQKHVRIIQKFKTLSNETSRISKKICFNQLRTSNNKNAFKNKEFATTCFTFCICFKYSKRSKFFTSLKFLSNIFCSRSLRKRFCFCKRFNFFCLKRANSFATFYVVSIFNFSRSSFFKIRSIFAKFAINFASSHFFFIRIHFAHFCEKKNKRHFFCAWAQRIHAIMIIILLMKILVTNY